MFFLNSNFSFYICVKVSHVLFLVHYRYNVDDRDSSEEDDEETQSNDIEATDQEENESTYSSVYSSVEETSVDSDGDSESGQVSSQALEKVEDNVPAKVLSPDKDCEPCPHTPFISEVTQEQVQADEIAQPQEEVRTPVVAVESMCWNLTRI